MSCGRKGRVVPAAFALRAPRGVSLQPGCAPLWWFSAGLRCPRRWQEPPCLTPTCPSLRCLLFARTCGSTLTGRSGTSPSLRPTTSPTGTRHASCAARSWRRASSERARGGALRAGFCEVLRGQGQGSQAVLPHDSSGPVLVRRAVHACSPQSSPHANQHLLASAGCPTLARIARRRPAPHTTPPPGVPSSSHPEAGGADLHDCRAVLFFSLIWR